MLVLDEALAKPSGEPVRTRMASIVPVVVDDTSDRHVSASRQRRVAPDEAGGWVVSAALESSLPGVLRLDSSNSATRRGPARTRGGQKSSTSAPDRAAVRHSELPSTAGALARWFPEFAVQTTRS